MKGSMNYNIHTAFQEDVLAISTVIHAASAEGVGLEGTPEELEAWQEENCRLSLISSRLLSTKGTTLVAQSSSKRGTCALVGTGFAKILDDGQGYIGALYCIVKEKGLGTQILEGLIAWLSEREVKTIRVVVSGNNIPMLTLAKKFGFEIVGEEKGQYFINGTWLVLERKS